MKEKKLLIGGKIFFKKFRKVKKEFNYLNMIHRIDFNKNIRYFVSMASNEPKEPKVIEIISLSPTEIEIGEYITLKLENGKTNIYIKGRLFRQCKN